MEDERIAKTILSALLKKEVVSVEMRRHEHPNVTRDKISMFRIDFAARVREKEGDVRLILIELQKTWLDTETLRFRRYLAAQYNAEENIEKEGANKGYAVPMVAVYLLGHRVGNIDKAVVYANHETVDYNGEVVKDGNKDPFITSLIHDSIIVQIPLLHGKINNHLDKVLSVFDQSHRDASNQQLMCLDPGISKVDASGWDSDRVHCHYSPYFYRRSQGFATRGVRCCTYRMFRQAFLRISWDFIPSFFHVQINIIRSPSQLIPSLSWRAFFSIVPFSIHCINRQDLAASIGCLPWIASYIA